MFEPIFETVSLLSEELSHIVDEITIRLQLSVVDIMITNYESPQNFLASPPEAKNTNHSSHMLSPTIRLHNCVFPTVFIVFLCLLCTIIVQPLAITFNKRYN